MSVAATLDGTKEADALNDVVFFVEVAALVGEEYVDVSCLDVSRLQGAG